MFMFLSVVVSVMSMTSSLLGELHKLHHVRAHDELQHSNACLLVLLFFHEPLAFQFTGLELFVQFQQHVPHLVTSLLTYLLVFDVGSSGTEHEQIVFLCGYANVFVESDSVRVDIAFLAAVRAIALEARLGHGE